VHSEIKIKIIHKSHAQYLADSTFYTITRNLTNNAIHKNKLYIFIYHLTRYSFGIETFLLLLCTYNNGATEILGLYTR
jgi:hypothetical protein